MIKSSDLLIFLEKTNLSGRSRSAISPTHLTISTYHDTASPTTFQHIVLSGHVLSTAHICTYTRENVVAERCIYCIRLES